MELYNLLNKDQTEHYIVGPKYMCWIFSIITIILFGCTIGINKKIIYISCFFLLCTFIFVWIYVFNCRVYGRKLYVNDGVLVLYSHHGKMLRTFEISEYFQQKCIVKFYYPKNVCNKIECLVLSFSPEKQEELEYRSYWNEKMLIISNPILIQIINATL